RQYFPKPHLPYGQPLYKNQSLLECQLSLSIYLWVFIVVYQDIIFRLEWLMLIYLFSPGKSVYRDISRI
ncbi:TPA: hypothetical protein ACWYIP_003229, partial [Escherichia coli]